MGQQCGKLSHIMMTLSNGNIFRVTGPLCGEFTGPGEFPTQRPVTRSFDVFFDLRQNKRLSKQTWGWWFETPSRSLWRHRNVTAPLCSRNLQVNPIYITLFTFALVHFASSKEQAVVTIVHNVIMTISYPPQKCKPPCMRGNPPVAVSRGGTIYWCYTPRTNIK